MKNKKTDIQNLIANARVGEAIDAMLALAAANNDTDLQQSMITIKARYVKVKQQENLGLMTYTEALKEQSFISYSILEILNKTNFAEGELESAKAIKEEQEAVKKVLFLASNPSDMGKLQLEKEYVRIAQSLQDGKINFRLLAEWAITPNDLQKALLLHKPNIVHFSGHGTNEGLYGGGIILQDANANSKIVSGDALANLFGIFAKRFKIELVVLNSCYSQEQAEGIGQHVPYVLGMNTAVNDNSAIEFSSGLYRGIGTEDDIEFAFELAKNMIQLEGLSGDQTPVMFKGGKLEG